MKSKKTRIIITFVLWMLLVLGLVFGLAISYELEPILWSTTTSFLFTLVAGASFAVGLSISNPSETRDFFKGCFAKIKKFRVTKRNGVIALISFVALVLGYVVCEFGVNTYVAGWVAFNALEYLLFIPVGVVLFAIFNSPVASLSTTFGCLSGIALGEVIGQKIIDNNWAEINALIASGVEVSETSELYNMADYHSGVFIWFGITLACAAVGLIVDALLKMRRRKLERRTVADDV